MIRSGMSTGALVLVAMLATASHGGAQRTSADYRALMFDRCAFAREGSASTAFIVARARPEVSRRRHQRRGSSQRRVCWIG